MRLLLPRPAFDRDLALAAAVALAFLGVYAATWQPAWYGDGVGLLNATAKREYGPAHPLMPAFARVIAHLVPGLGPVSAVRVAMLASAAPALGLCFLVARRMNAGRGAALGATVLAGVSPAVWFFATTVEVHVVHLAVAAAVCLAALHLGAAAEGGRALPLLGVAATAPLLVPSHASGVLLIPGIAGLAWWSRLRAGGRGLAALLPAVLVGVAAASGRLLSDGLRYTFFDGWSSDQREIVEAWHQWSLEPGRVLLHGWLLPLGLLLVLPLVEAVLSARRDPLLCVVLLLLILPELAFFVWFGFPERGGYALAVVPGAAAGAALLLQRLPARAGLMLVLVGAVLHVALTWTLGLAARGGSLVGDRLSVAARALPEGGTLFSQQAHAPRLDYYRPDVIELPLHPLIFGARDAGIAPEDFGPRLLELGCEGPTAFDLGCLGNPHLAQAGMLPYLESVARTFEAQPGCRRARAGDWEFLAFDLRPTPAEHGR